MTKKSKQGSETRPSGGPRLSLCMIVRDEASNLGACLKAIRPAVDEIVVVDTGSRDKTKAIAREAGARVFDFPWEDDFSAARNASLAHATGDYILWLDADDRVSLAEVARLRAFKQQLPADKQSAYFLVVRSHSQSSSLQFLQLRIFPNIPAARFEGRIHEQISDNLRKAGLRLVTTDLAVDHEGNRDPELFKTKALRNLRIITDDLAKDPENPVLNFHAGRTLASLNRREEAIQHMERVLNHPEAKTRYRQVFLEASLLTGRYYDELGMTFFAEKLLEQLAAAFPEVAMVHFFYGENLLKNKKPREAVAKLNESLRHPLETGFYPLDLEDLRFQQRYLLALAHLRLDEFDASRNLFSQLLAEKPEDANLLQAMALLALKTGHYAEAARLLETQLCLGRKTDSIYADLGLALHKQGFYDQAEKAYMAALEINPDRLEALINLGSMYQARKSPAKALGSFQRALRLDPDATDVKLACCEIHLGQGNYELLIQEAGRLLRDLGMLQNQPLDSMEDLAGLFGRIGEQLLEQGREASASMAFRVGFSVYPLPPLIHNLLRLSIQYGKLPELLETIKGLLERFAGDAKAIQAVDQLTKEIAKRVEAKAQPDGAPA